MAEELRLMSLMMWSLTSKVVKDIRSWIILFFLIRMVGITHPPLEVAHNWRQAAVNTVARNFEKINANILYPRFDTAGQFSGVSGTEFPLFNYLIFLCNHVFGFAHWYGRLINLIVSSIAIFFFHRLTHRWFNANVAFFATLILLASLWFTFSRKIMPDTFSLSLVMIGLYYGLEFLSKGGGLNLIRYALLIGLGLLAKIPAVILFVLILIPLLSNAFYAARKLALVLVSVVPLSFVGWWYFYWFNHITTDYQLFRMGPGMVEGYKQLIAAPFDWLDNFYFDALKFSGFTLFCWGLYHAASAPNKRLLMVFSLSLVACLLFMMQAGHGFGMHEYYTLPFVPIMALVAGYGLSMINNNQLRKLLLVIILVEGVANQQHDFFLKQEQQYKIELAAFIEAHIDGEELVIVNGGQNPQMMYFAQRRGWTETSEQLMDERIVADHVQNGAAFLIWDKHVADASSLAINAIAENEHFIIFDLKHASNGVEYRLEDGRTQ